MKIWYGRTFRCVDFSQSPNSTACKSPCLRWPYTQRLRRRCSQPCSCRQRSWRSSALWASQLTRWRIPPHRPHFSVRRRIELFSSSFFHQLLILYFFYFQAPLSLFCRLFFCLIDLTIFGTFSWCIFFDVFSKDPSREAFFEWSIGWFLFDYFQHIKSTHPKTPTKHAGINLAQNTLQASS